MSPSSKPTPRMIRVYHALSQQLGAEPADIWVFDPAELPTPSPQLRLIHVAVWPADEKCDVTSFSTLGMAERCMAGADYLAELHMSIRAPLEKEDRHRVSAFLANVAQYPFDHDRKLDWWEVISRPGAIPTFEGCRHLLLHPRLTEDGFDEIEDPEGRIKVLYIVPITPLERHLLIDHSRGEFVRHLVENEIDILKDRFDPEGWDRGQAE